jgi:hypothetical protein
MVIPDPGTFRTGDDIGNEFNAKIRWQLLHAPDDNFCIFGSISQLTGVVTGITRSTIVAGILLSKVIEQVFSPADGGFSVPGHIL